MDGVRHKCPSGSIGISDARLYWGCLAWTDLDRLDDGSHGPARIGHARVGAIGVDLVPAELGLFKLAGYDDGAPRGVHFHGSIQGRFGRQNEQLAEHFDDVVVRMFVIVEQNHVKERRKAFFFDGFGLWNGGRGQVRW